VPHPTGKMLYNYVLGWTNREQTSSIVRYIAYCDLCLDEVMHISGIENEHNEELMERADSKERG